MDIWGRCSCHGNTGQQSSAHLAATACLSCISAGGRWRGKVFCVAGRATLASCCAGLRGMTAGRSAVCHAGRNQKYCILALWEGVNLWLEIMPLMGAHRHAMCVCMHLCVCMCMCAACSCLCHALADSVIMADWFFQKHMQGGTVGRQSLSWTEYVRVH
jgi:hypothetical protein